MKFKSPMLVVKDIDKSVDFYKRILGLRITLDFGANKSLTGGISLQTLLGKWNDNGRNIRSGRFP